MISMPELKRPRYGAPAAETVGAGLAGQLGAQSIADLRAMDASALTLAAARLGFLPLGVVDGKVLPRQLVDTFNNREQARVPILAGFNSGEVRSLRGLAPKVPASAAAYESAIHLRYGDLAGAFLKLYPSANAEESILATTRDALYGWTAERLVRSQAAIGQPAYLYLFDHGYPAADKAGLHAFHGSELPFVFGTADRLPAAWPKIPQTSAETALSDAMIGYWTSFARSGAPTAAGAPAWPRFGPSEAYLHITDAPRPDDHLLPGMYALMEETVCRRRENGKLGWNWSVGLASPPMPAPSKACGGS